MANVKNGACREMTIDRLLQDRRGHSTREMLEKCNHELERRGEEPITALNTIRNDMLSIENRWHIVIEQVKTGRNIRYRYADPCFSIFNSPLTGDEIAQLSQSVSMLRRFEGMPGFEWVDELGAHVESAVSIDAGPIVGFDENARLKGMEFFTPLFNCIRDKQPILLGYRPYNAGEEFKVVLHPYYIKEYNQRWFLFGLDDARGRLSTCALDRIESLEKAHVKYVENTGIDFGSYFDDVVGVSNDARKKKEVVTLLVDKGQLPYLLSKPLHRSQELIETRGDGSGILSISVKPNYELVQSLLSFGERVTVLSPEHLRDEIVGRIKKNLENYGMVQMD